MTPLMERFVLHWGEMGSRWGLEPVGRSGARLSLSAGPGGGCGRDRGNLADRALEGVIEPQGSCNSYGLVKTRAPGRCIGARRFDGARRSPWDHRFIASQSSAGAPPARGGPARHARRMREMVARDRASTANAAASPRALRPELGEALEPLSPCAAMNASIRATLKVLLRHGGSSRASSASVTASPAIALVKATAAGIGWKYGHRPPSMTTRA